MGDNNGQEAADLDAILNDGDNLFEVIYRGGRLDNHYNEYDNLRPLGVPDYTIPDDVNIRLVIHSSITKIDYAACRCCGTLIEVVFHIHVTQICSKAFDYCRNLRRIELPEGLLRLEAYAIQLCHSLRVIVVPASVQYMGDQVFDGCTSLERVIFAPRTSNVELGSGMFHYCPNLRFVTLPQNLRSIPARFFQRCISLTHLQLPESVEQIEYCAFGWSGLRSVTISKNVHHISWRAFDHCAFLERVTIYSTNLNLGNDIFDGCPLLSTIMIAPWLWPKLFVSMNGHPEFILKFFRQYHTKILDFETPDVRLFRRLRRDKRRR